MKNVKLYENTHPLIIRIDTRLVYYLYPYVHNYIALPKVNLDSSAFQKNDEVNHVNLKYNC